MSMIQSLDPSVYDSQNYVVLDFETTNLRKGTALERRNDVVVACWYVVNRGKVTRKHQASGIMAQKELFVDIREADFLVVQSAQFEVKWLKRMGLDLHKLVVYDTLLAEWVLAGNRRWNKDLDAICHRLGIKNRKDPYISTCIKNGICPSDLPLGRVTSYCNGDVDATYKVFHEQMDQLKEVGQTHLAYQRSMASITLADIAFAGMCLDKDVVYTMYQAESIRFNESLAALTEIGQINWNSHPQKRAFIYDELKFPVPVDWNDRPLLTKGGAVTTATEVISDFIAETPEQQAFLDVWFEYAQSHGRLTKTLQFFKGACDEYDCMINANINQGTAVSHRLNSSGVPLHITEFEKEKSAQFQNIDNFLKRAIHARRKGWSIGDTDAAGLEMRVAIELARDLQGYQDILSNHDFHSFTASELLGRSFIRGDKEQRRRAKRDTFKPLYYGRSGTPEQRRYYAAFRGRYADIDQVQSEWIDTVLNDRELVLPYGMRYYWPDVSVSAKGYVKYSTNICNYPVQGFATAEIIPLGVVKAWQELSENNAESFLINTVHDSVMGEVHPEEHEMFTEITQKGFADDVYPILKTLYGYEFATPLGAETQIGEHWSEGSEIKYESKTPFKFRPRQERLAA